MARGLSCSAKDLPRSGIKPVSPDLAGGFFFFTTEPPREPYRFVFIHFLPSLFADLCHSYFWFYHPPSL